MREAIKHFLVVLLVTGWALGQEAKPRVYVTNHESWQEASTLVAGTYSGATRAEQIKTLAKVCPAITVTEDQARANFFVAWDTWHP